MLVMQGKNRLETNREYRSTGRSEIMKKKSIYVVSSNEDKEEARKLMSQIVIHDIFVHDWTRKAPGMTFAEKSKIDYEQMIYADVILVVNPARVTPGKYFEIGACYALHKRIVSIDGDVVGAYAGTVEIVPSITFLINWMKSH